MGKWNNQLPEVGPGAAVGHKVENSPPNLDPREMGSVQILLGGLVSQGKEQESQERLGAVMAPV